MQLAFVCVGNAGRSQFASALAERAITDRDLDIDVRRGGTDPADHIHEEVRITLLEDGIDIGDREPRPITDEELADSTIVVTMGCSIADRLPDDWAGHHESWSLDHPKGDDLDTYRQQRDDIRDHVEDLLNRIERGEISG